MNEKERKSRRAKANRRMDRADGCWKQYPVGATVEHIETGEELKVVEMLRNSGDGFSLYLVTDDCGNQRFAVRAMIERMRTKDKRRRAL